MADAAVVDAPRVDAPAATGEAPAEPADVVWAADPRLTPPAAAPPADSEPPATSEPPAADATPDKASADGAVPDGSDWKAKLDAGDAELLRELLTHPKLAGHVGTLADRIARERADKAAQDDREAALDRAAQEDPDNPLAQARLQQRQTEIQQLSEVQARLGAFTAAQEGVEAFVTSLPEDARAEIAKLAPAGKTYGEPGDLKSALGAYMADVVAGAVAADRVAQRAIYDKETLPGLRKEVQAEVMGKDRAPDLGVGAATGTGGNDLTPDKYARMTPSEMQKLTSTPAGRARIDAMWAANP